MSSYAESRGVPTKTDESGFVFLDHGCDENVLSRKSDVFSDKLETPISSDSEIFSGDSDNYSSVPETSTDTSETHEQGSSDEPDIQVADSGTSDNGCGASQNSECGKHSDSSSATPDVTTRISEPIFVLSVACFELMYENSV
ncbi:hypothetical protein HanRHA438_Chr02g0064801 [Helianthus annuus]|nr:hypothetical protein HanIR_Chr02g0070681 [Helianthus annuus]KAJ0618629.1 hypothetical protein HanHA89_Chr02g0055611 [Helianthus annuus]KAJ0777086.1 hypothetical protein HanLR1_Chr02g0053231 [Helianthus annuus]KAJ0939755.1 hypothetical protein HanRHA438_Chr02g0064801 [Helianthus annuus]